MKKEEKMPTEIAMCPKCKTKLLDELHEYFTKNCSDSIFEYECLKCHTNMEVNVDSIPLFACSTPDKKFDTVGVGSLL